ncbi:MAG: flagellar biosynthesis protein FlhA [Rhodospirillaceae bacterium]|jgi:flagellar biosynthesis protein FlhA|nr:flagellar biosynthesis protein FlhA [Rhodospirillaceae bacterium]MBT4491450.1 flagellar biosynthesis protein FlhA [Rhodospirillaceae bacterium]MBT5193996.1 flagellar biosynthesis protein FlhA [Rhodospirillaceae bacterium]MBT5894469.1 flagellar biosynthesis protein FlhA [Rhodospirillaceae bacterium]MBT6429750.1 flagellar biosynthesis protein FlhA [Rhodospirillaceae bacterium]
MSDTSTEGSAGLPAPGGDGQEGGGSAAPGLDYNSILRNGFGRMMQGDVALALGVSAILVVLILPLPNWLLDVALAVSITFSVMILMTCLFISRPLEFSSFPTVLLIATMLRLSLNLASTRLILSDGHEGTHAAGRVIEAFGNFVMGGNFVIGVIVFSILIIVNFIVITKGSGRIAEVAARFSLDAMPGKQMAIDADLSAGLINEDEARLRRRTLEDESTFFGAMDGAAKFVRGDAIAGLLITFINVIGGIIVGVAQNDLSFSEATQSYTLLTVGDGLVSQIPALIVSTASGLLVSKAGVVGSTDKALFSQLSGYPKAMGLVSFLLLCLSLLPGLPMLPFFALAVITGAMTWRMMRQNIINETLAAEAVQREQEETPPVEEPISTALAIDELRIELGYGLLSLINDTRGHRLTDQIKALRRQIAGDMGFIMPSIRILDNMQLPASIYALRIKEVEAGRGDLRPDKLLVMDPNGGEIELHGEATTEPTFNLPAMWVDESLREEASFRGYTVVDPPTVVTTHLTEVLRDNMADLLSYAATQRLLNDLPHEHQKLVEDVVPAQLSVTAVQRVLQRLLSERISIRDLPTILEGIAEAVGFTQNVVQIAEHVRSRLARQISHASTTMNGYIPLVPLSPEWEQNFAESITGQGDDMQLAMAPSKLQEFIGRIREVFDELVGQGEIPVLLTSPAARPYVRSIIERIRPTTPVLSQNEIHPSAKIRTLAQI